MSRLQPGNLSLTGKTPDILTGLFIIPSLVFMVLHCGNCRIRRFQHLTHTAASHRTTTFVETQYYTLTVATEGDMTHAMRALAPPNSPYLCTSLEVCTVALSKGVASACDSSASGSAKWHHDACFSAPRRRRHDERSQAQTRNTLLLCPPPMNMTIHQTSAALEEKEGRFMLFHVPRITNTKWLLLAVEVSWHPF